VLLLRDVLDWPAADVAEVINASSAAVKSALQRARARLDDLTPSLEDMSEPTDARARAQLDAYIAAFESGDVHYLEQLLRQDAVLETMPDPAWFNGRATCLGVITASLGSPGEWRMVPVAANGQPGAAAYRRGADNAYHAFGIALLTPTASGIARITLFGDPGLVARFNLPRRRPG
jgi:RNA polymerase sigma-70 factor (ECF subfamily)